MLQSVAFSAGTGKTRVLAALARVWDGPVFGTATSQNATNGLRQAGIQVTANTTRILGAIQRGMIPPGALIVADEASMISVTHLAAIAEYAARHRCKLILAGDQEQLAAVEGGGAMMLLADRLGYVQLAEPVRFTAAWERAASLRLRSGDVTALDEYDQHGRIRGAPPDHAIDQASRAYLASYLAGRNVLLMAADWARCRELSARIRDDLIHLGLVDAGRTIRIADGAEASAGDLIICRANDHHLEAGEPGRALANGDVLRIEAITGRAIMVRRLLDPDPATGCCPALKIPILAAFTMPMKNRAFRAVSWGRCRSTWARCRTQGRFSAVITVCGQARAGNGAGGSASRGHGQQPAAGQHVDPRPPAGVL